MAQRSTFTLDITKFVKKAQGNIDLVQKKVALDVFRRVIMRTPVDTGTARARWTLGIGDIRTGGSTDIDKGTVNQRGSGNSKTVNAVAMELTKAPPILNKSMFLANNIEYILPLEYGSSGQAPGGMVRLTVGEFSGIVRANATQVKNR